VATKATRSPHHELKTKLGSPQVAGTTNSVQVDPGGATFPTIGAALASITDASQEKEYLLTVGPGAYNETVTLKPWCYVHGSGPDQTVVTAPPTQQQYGRGTIVTCSNSSVSDMTVSCTGGSWGDWSTALNIGGSSPFYAENVMLVSDDEGNAGINSETVAVNWNPSQQGPSQVYLSYATVLSTMRGSESTAVALIVNGDATAELTESKVAATGSNQTFGITTSQGAGVTLYNSAVQGATWAIYMSDGTGTVVATNCQIDGPVSPGVQIVNN
jgi:pectin methylesterase-like acyl-CoA thioesterase